MKDIETQVMKYFVAVTAGAILMGVFAAWRIDELQGMPEIVSRWEHTIPSPMELQRFLGVDDDGVIGPATMDAWTGYIYNEKAKPYMEDANFIERQADVWQ